MIELSIKIKMPSDCQGDDVDYLAHRLKEVLQHDVQTIVQGIGISRSNANPVVDVTLHSIHEPQRSTQT